MAGKLKVRKRLLSWSVFVSPYCPRNVLKSPVFWFENCECFFLLAQCGEDHSVYRIYLSMEESRQVKISSYVKGEYSHAMFQEDIITTSGLIGANHRVPSTQTSEVKIFCFIFDRSTLCLEKKKDFSCLEKLSSDFSNLLSGDVHHDVILKCGDVTVKAHKAVLSCRSKVFSTMFQSNTEEGRTGHVDIQDINSSVFMIFIRYLYTGKLQELTSENAKSLYEAGNKYEIEDLMKISASFSIKDSSTGNA